MRAIIYRRVSTEEQASEGHSLDAQLRVCTDFAQARGWHIVGVFSDPEGADAVPASDATRRRRPTSSGKTDQRPGFQKMIAAARAGQCDVVLTHKLDRFSRSITDVLLYLREFSDRGIAYTSATEQFDFTSPLGKVLLALLAAFAEWYLDNLSAETSKGKRARAESGYWNGDLSWGYRVTDDGEAEPDPAAAPGVLMAFTDYATGLYRDVDIARRLNEADYRTGNKRGATPFSKDTVRAMLQNPFYTGRVTYKGEVLPGRHAAIVPQDLWDECQMVRRRLSGQRRAAPARTRIYPLAGVVYCVHCRRPLRGQFISRRRYYRDVDADYDGGCTAPRYLRADHAEAMVAAALMAVRLTDAHRRQVLALLDAGETAEAVQRKRQAAQAKIRRASEMYVEGNYDRVAYDSAVREAQAVLDALRPARTADLSRAARLLGNLPDLWAAATDAERKTLIQSMIERAYFAGPELRYLQPLPEIYAFLGHLVGSGPDGGRITFRLHHREYSTAILAPATPAAAVPVG